MANIDVRLLRYFIAVAETGHMTRAAERLGIGQPPLSQQIRVLETQLGVTLFDRLPRGMALTDAGQAFLADACEVVRKLDQAVDDVRRVAAGIKGRLSVGFTSSSALHPFVPTVIRAFRRDAPSVSLMLDESSTSELLDGLRDGQLDAAFIRQPQGDIGQIAFVPVLEEAMVLAVPSAHALALTGRAGKAAVPMTAVAAEKLILYRRRTGQGLYDAIIAACHSAGFSPNIEQEAPRLLSTLSLVAAGLGVSVVPASLMRMQIEGIVYRPLSPAPRAPLHFAYREGVLAGPSARLLDHVRATAQSFVARP
ncbi:LysR family transcriptional regulator [Pandoraea nosoerga]|uniref:LysR family transcriptional regulator n=1 Tax=Pandoraea nosoerga TaxID=2508296 RepID=A0A5E4U5N5_9BURK|nr:MULTISPECIES: LysR family transcriptional regulator [Pandoraea]MBN4667834.1 LysR family transcriptional regulator [Pandoraea nosoerga]MBN4677686.1 LysR family transcriptional regulator [Pandoraea nosoerga]MBN4682703.1 LysR family transcriptional regulator [Pandoraea nosoerga]MBN4746902.1 LysR family transcriptional regulator [Pandoraea nosoerga]VVD94913.1 LysR family transcriptional regulator [Pandoraea nosoerga]